MPIAVKAAVAPRLLGDTDCMAVHYRIKDKYLFSLQGGQNRGVIEVSGLAVVLQEQMMGWISTTKARIIAISSTSWRARPSLSNEPSRVRFRPVDLPLSTLLPPHPPAAEDPSVAPRIVVRFGCEYRRLVCLAWGFPTTPHSPRSDRSSLRNSASLPPLLLHISSNPIYHLSQWSLGRFARFERRSAHLNALYPFHRLPTPFARRSPRGIARFLGW